MAGQDSHMLGRIESSVASVYMTSLLQRQTLRGAMIPRVILDNRGCTAYERKTRDDEQDNRRNCQDIGKTPNPSPTISRRIPKFNFFRLARMPNAQEPSAERRANAPGHELDTAKHKPYKFGVFFIPDCLEKCEKCNRAAPVHQNQLFCSLREDIGARLHTFRAGWRVGGI